MRRITLVAASLEILGGQGVQAALLSQALREDGYHVRFLAIDRRLPRWAAWVRRIPYVRTVVNELFYLASLSNLARGDVVHVFSASYWSFLLAPVPAMIVGRALGKRVVLHYHSGEADDHLARWGWLVHPWLGLAHELVVPSAYLQEVFARHGYASTVIPNVVDLAAFRFRRRTVVRPRLLSTRNLEPYYRVDVVLRAFARVLSCRRDARLIVAGYGSQRRTLEALAARLGIREAVRFAGRTEPANVPALFEESDVFLNASVVDNQPVSILEAFAAGTPVVTTAAGDIPDMTHGGKLARLVPMDDPEAMADAVLALLAEDGEAARLADSAHRGIGRFTWPAVRSSWHAVYANPAEVPAPTRSVTTTS